MQRFRTESETGCSSREQHLLVPSNRLSTAGLVSGSRSFIDDCDRSVRQRVDNNKAIIQGRTH